MPSYQKWAMKLALGCAASLGTLPAFAADAPSRLVPVPQATSVPQAGAESKAIDLEVIRERYADRSVKVERHVSQDSNLNYINHGPWTMWDPQGNVIAKGESWQGKRHGEWKRFFPATAENADPAAAAGDALTAAEYKEFKRPFTSSATFVDDKMVGNWSVVDADGKPLFSIDLDREIPQGKMVVYHANGQKKREIEFKAGVVNGEWQEWDATGASTRKDLYIEGRRQADAVTKHDSNGEKSSEGTYLYAKEIVKVDSDFWTGGLKLSIAGTEGKTIKQGKWIYWYEDGGKRCEAEYIDDKAVGRHSWWFRNGQKESEGEFIDGQAQGTWVYWHENGQKAAQGDYLNGTKVGRWVRWSDEGQVVENKEHGAGDGRVQNAQNVPGFPSFPNGQVTQGPVTSGQMVPGQTYVIPQPGTTVTPSSGIQPIPQTTVIQQDGTAIQGASMGQPVPQPQPTYVPQYSNSSKKSGGFFRRR
ncbi:MAG: hypothetical protein IT428_15910 [Planctomycetaceae bacterium]|nr:hypothetical protein [Planctomycetaceae bacterium]